MRPYLLRWLAIGMLTVSGCTAAPRLPPEHRISIAEVVDRVQCELQELVEAYTVRHPQSQNYQWLLDWAAAYELSLQVDATGNVSATSDIIDILSAGIFTLTLGAGASEASQRIAVVKFSINLAELQGYRCAREPNAWRFFGRDTGMRDWIDRVMGSYDAEDRLVKHRPSTFSQSLEFKIKLEGSASGLWSFVHAKTKPALGGSLQDGHKLAVAFAEIEQGGKKRKGKKRGVGFAPVDPSTQNRLNQELLNLQLRSLQVR